METLSLTSTETFARFIDNKQFTITPADIDYEGREYLWTVCPTNRRDGTTCGFGQTLDEAMQNLVERVSDEGWWM